MPIMIGQTISHYKILEKLGEGGMGVVYKAHDTMLDRDVALKFLPAHVSVSQEIKARFLQEAKAAAALNHAHICTIHGVEEEGGQMFIVMEYIEGCTLRTTLPFPKVNDALSVAIQIGEALQEAHSKGIVHRDIKADNIMLTSKGQAKVMDFGLAKLRGSLKLTKTSSTVGTLAYMAPEQIQGGEVDVRSDIFSFGVLLFEMLTGKTPFRGEHEAAMMYSILNEEPGSVQQNRQDVTADVDRIIHRALEKDPEDRYQSVADMVSELRREQKKSTRVIRPSAAEPTIPRTSEAEMASDIPVKNLKSRLTLLSALGLGLFALALAIYFFSGHHQTIDSLAVLPFENVGADPNTEYLSDGITESLMNSLSQLSNLTVMSRSSVFHYKGKDIDPQKAGKELGVKAVLAGRVTQRGNNLQISAELVDVSNNSHIWGEQYNKKLSDILAVQEDISKEISQQLRLKLVREDEKKLTKRSTENTEAYQLYWKGKFHWNKRKDDALQKAVEYFNQAIEKDPGYALAYAGLASTYAVLPEYSGLPARDFMAKAETAARKAQELDATLAEPHAVLGYIKYVFQWDWEGAEIEFRRAIELDPNSPTTHHWYCIFLRVQAKFEEALSEIKRAQDLDPLSPVINANVGEVLSYMRHDDLAIEKFNKTLELDPNFSLAHMDLGLLYTRQSKYDEALSEMQKVRQIVGVNSPYGMGNLGYVYARAGKTDEAIKTLNRLLNFSKEGYTVSVQIACVYAGLGDKAKTFEWLGNGYNEHNNYLRDLKTWFVWDNLRSDPRYMALLKKIRLEK
jgi:serine/threonine protein kinase/Tfp pilus assembly protein PilF